MSKKQEVLAKVEEIARRHGAGHLVDTIKREVGGIWGADEASAAAPAPAPRTRTFNVLVGVEVLESAQAYQSAVESAVKEALESAAAGRDEVVSLSVTGA